MAEVKVCGVCNKEEAVETCEVCGIPLCERHLKRIPITEKTPASEALMGVNISAVRPGLMIRKVCRKCMMETEFYDGEYY